MKSKFLLKGLLASLMLFCSAHTWAYDFKTNGIYYNFSSGHSLKVTYGDINGNSYSGNIVIPEEITWQGSTYTVGGIDIAAFSQCTNLTSVTIPSTVTTIDNTAFYNCTKLSTITLPERVTSIGNNAFQNCTNLKQINLPESMTSIGTYTFFNCTSLTSIDIPDNVVSMDNYAFGLCESLAQVNIGSGLTEINFGVFGYCDALAEVIIPDNITSLGECAFFECPNLTTVTLSSNLTTIGDNAFTDCYNLSEIYSNNSTPPTIYENTFSNVNKELCVIFVPANCRETYSNANYWSEFYNIVDTDPSYYHLYAGLVEGVETARELLENVWNTITTDYADVASDYKGEYDTLANELNQLLDEVEDAYNNGSLTNELAQDIRAKLEEIKQKIEAMLAATQEAHEAAGIEGIFSNYVENVQFYDMFGRRVVTPQKDKIYIMKEGKHTIKVKM